ncbi:hypothetical protein D6829_00155 [Candidatus Pacearchaeota archaeon]|nr:MAG: hypothetical protein D6829_00155 [Candidatus Pacearchaeota archaeon]
MDSQEFVQLTGIVVISSVVLAFATTLSNKGATLAALLSFLIIIVVNILAKKISGGFFDVDVKTKFWTFSQFGFRSDMRLKQPIPMIWLPLLVSLFSWGAFWWLAVLEFDVAPKPERASRRHGIYRFTQVTEWHIAWIALWGIIANVVLAIAGYLAGFGMFARFSLYFAIWSIVPFSSLDGSKIFFGSRGLWAAAASVLGILFVWSHLVI